MAAVALRLMGSRAAGVCAVPSTGSTGWWAVLAAVHLVLDDAVGHGQDRAISHLHRSKALLDWQEGKSKRTCEESGCHTHAKFGYPGGLPVRCRMHMLGGMVGMAATFVLQRP